MERLPDRSSSLQMQTLNLAVRWPSPPSLLSHFLPVLPIIQQEVEGQRVDAIHPGLFPGMQSRWRRCKSTSEGANTCGTATALTVFQSVLSTRPTTSYIQGSTIYFNWMTWQPCLVVAPQRRNGMNSWIPMGLASGSGNWWGNIYYINMRPSGRRNSVHGGLSE